MVSEFGTQVFRSYFAQMVFMNIEYGRVLNPATHRKLVFLINVHVDFCSSQVIVHLGIFSYLLLTFVLNIPYLCAQVIFKLLPYFSISF